MRVGQAAIMPYAIPLTTPLRTARGTVDRRRGVILALTDGDGLVGLGEAAPLPGFSTESAEQAWSELSVLLESSSPLRGRRLDRPEDVAVLVDELGWSPSASCALDQALGDLLARRNGCPLAAWLRSEAASAVRVHRLVRSAAEARDAVLAGIGTVKVKVGAGPLGEDLRRVSEIRRAVGSEVGLRLDANGAWTAVEAIRAVEALAPYGPRCIEQPTPAGAHAEMAAVRRRSSVPIAADESVRSGSDLRALAAAGAAEAVVLKPMLVGGLSKAVELAEEATALGLGVTVTTSLETAVGRVGALHVAAAFPARRAGSRDLDTHGLDTGALLARDLAEGPVVREGRMSLPDAHGLGISLEGP